MDNKNKKKEITEKLKIEKELFASYDTKNPEELRELQTKIIKLHSNLPDIVIRKYFPRVFSDFNLLQDLKQCGFIGMMVAVEKYKAKHKSASSFFNYASFWALKFIYEGIEGNRTIPIPQYVALKINKELTRANTEIKDNNYLLKTVQEMKEARKEFAEGEDNGILQRVAKDINLDTIPLWGFGIRAEGEEYRCGTVDLEAEMPIDSDEEGYYEIETVLKGFLKTFFDKPKNKRNLEIYFDHTVSKMSMRQIAAKHNMHHAQISNILKGKEVKGEIKAKPFIDKARDHIKTELSKQGYSFEDMSYDEFKSTFIESFVVSLSSRTKENEYEE